MTKLMNLRRPVLPVPAEASAPTAGPTVDVPMTALDRRRVRRRLSAPDGTELLLSFLTGTVLTPGLVLEERGGVRYVVAAAPEEVAVITLKDASEAVRVAHAIGNLHRDIIEDGPMFLALWDAPLELLLTRLGADFTRETRPFYGRPSWENEG